MYAGYVHELGGQPQTGGKFQKKEEFIFRSKEAGFKLESGKKQLEIIWYKKDRAELEVPLKEIGRQISDKEEFIRMLKSGTWEPVFDRCGGNGKSDFMISYHYTGVLSKKADGYWKVEEIVYGHGVESIVRIYKT
ncbi:MAG: hypothetical protein HFH32_11790 [Eubacterium sp.]|nr:hypothetical protein [Eubacterium sp.]